jgi:hypothetical protein
MCEKHNELMNYKNTMQGKRFLWYVCCGPAYPNTFIGSNLLESVFIGVLSSNAGMDGFLRWNYTVWPDDPRHEIRYGTWRAGDTNFVYPANHSAPLLSLRYKNLKRGIQFYELLEALKAKGSDYGKALEEAYNKVVVGKDVSVYYSQGLSLEQMCSLNPDDYDALKEFVLDNLVK